MQTLTDRMYKALLDLVCCPAFNSMVFEKDKESHKAWSIARMVIDEYQKEAEETTICKHH